MRLHKVLSAAAIQPVCLTTDHSLDLGDFTEGRKSGEARKKNPRSTEEANYNNSTHMSSTFFENQHRAIHRWSPIQLTTYRWNSVVNGNMLTPMYTGSYALFSNPALHTHPSLTCNSNFIISELPMPETM